ncbi:hypothetical protein KUW18_06205 [Halomonas sp. DP5Y7-2]|uniref:hypothetical protein n=1 Tax=Halomonas sp. DP5Y7-2 TaxID=2859076 RepID=UPI001C99570D|nr:hypothetical protein [Halomonas sp. DP5Y7-2]MBY5983685.1 hypothetical protein [Halomonas sp. DP5Y7-2]
MTEASTLPADTEDGNAQTRLMPQGRDVAIGGSPLLFYAVGRDKLVSVSPEGAAHFIEECRLMEMVVEDHQSALAELSAANSNYVALMMSARRDHRFLMDKQLLQTAIVQAQHKVEDKNRVLKSVIEPLTNLSSDTNKVMELIPIRRGESSAEYFRLAYVRSHIIMAFAEEILLPRGNVDASESVMTDGLVDWEKLRSQLEEFATTGKIQIDFPWFDDWLKKEETTIDLFKWSKALNENLKYSHSIVSGEEHDRDSYRVELSAEAQLMRWTSGASGLSGEINPFEGTAFLKADAKAELVLAQAKATVDFYTPVGGLMLACELPGGQVMDLGMIRCRTLIAGAGGVGASIAAELNLNIEVSEERLQANGVPGELVSFGLPGEQRVILRENDSNHAANNEVSVGMEAFAGGKMDASMGVQLEWKSPEEGNTFQPFAKAVAGRGVLAGAGFTVDFHVRYEEGKFRISARAGACLGFGSKGKIDFEVDTDLLMEFVKWVVYQLKNIDYGKLIFIDDGAYYALSNIVAASSVSGEAVWNYLEDRVKEVSDVVQEYFYGIVDGANLAARRGDFSEKINEDLMILKHTTPDAKGMIIYWLMQTNAFDRMYPGNRDLEGWWESPSLFGFMNDRKEAVMNVLRLIQSKSELRSVMKRVVPRVGEVIDLREGQRIVEAFLAKGEKNLPPPLSSHYESDFLYLRARLRENASIGTEVYRNDSRDYFTQASVSSNFRKPCENMSDCVVY